MSEKRKIEAKLNQKEKEIQSLTQKIKDAKVYAKALRDVLSLINKDDSENCSESKLKSGSAVAQAKQIIIDQGEPVHIDNILRAMGKEVTRDVKSSLTSSLAAYVRRKEIFVRTAPNTFGLLELGHSEVGVISDEPPSGFGGITSASDLDEEIPF